MTRHVSLALSATMIAGISAEVPARAQAEEIKSVAGKAADRARRSISLGPTGGAGLSLSSEGDADGVFSFGLGLFWFKDSLFDIGSMRDEIKERVQKKLLAKLIELGVEEKDLSREDLAKLKDELWAEVKAEFRERLDAKPTATPKPRLNLLLEGAYLPRADAWQVRGGLGIGVSKLTIGPTLVGNFGDASGFAVGLEAAFHYLVGSGNRPFGLQFFLRYDYFVNNREAFGHQGALGVRAFLDII